MEEDDADNQFGFVSSSVQMAPPLVSLSPFSTIPSSSSRRLSSCFNSSRPLSSCRRLSWVSLQGRLVNADEASSAKAIGGGLSPDEVVAWELFSPIHRFLIVAVIGVAVAESRKSRVISQLRKSVELRDQVLSSMQQKLDNLCEQLNSVNNQAGIRTENVESQSKDAFGCDKIKCGCWHYDQHQDVLAGLMGNSFIKVSNGNQVTQYKMPLMNEVEPEERRMSDLSDWASSVTSTAEIQLNTFGVDQDIFNLKRECEEKDATIKELTTTLQSTNIAGSKRIAELEDIIRRKNTMITKLKKDMLVLEQKVVQLTRLRRPSFSPSTSESWQLPLMVDNIVYNMDSSTSPSSSDSDSSPVNRRNVPVVGIQETRVQSSHPSSEANQKSAPTNVISSRVRPTKHHTKSRPVSPLQEISTNQKSTRFSSLRTKQLSASGDIKKTKRQTQTATGNTTPKKRWF